MSDAPNNTSAQTKSDPLWMRWLFWIFISGYIVALSGWSFNAGMRVREDAFANSHTIRFHGSLQNALEWGGMVLTAARDHANGLETKTAPDAQPSTRPDTRPTSRPSTLSASRPTAPSTRPALAHQPAHPPIEVWQVSLPDIYYGVDQVYQNMVYTDPPDANYGLDYPPLRLFTMSLWTRHVAGQVHSLATWPGTYDLQYSAKGDPADLLDENAVSPMLHINAGCSAAAGVLVFILVWIWTRRGGRPCLAKRTGWRAWLLPKQKLTPWKPVRLSRIHGLAVFLITTSAFFYAVVVVENPVSSPPPSITFESRPVLAAGADGKPIATFRALIDGQGADAKWRVDWGTGPLYGNETRDDVADATESTATLRALPPHTLIHYRLTATSAWGITHTADETFDTSDALGPAQSPDAYGAVWPGWPLWLGISFLFLLMIGSLRWLPAVHRAWAGGLVAGLMLWFDPALLMNAHVWPQWDVWLLPPFLLAAVLTSLDWWFTAGLVLGAGMMFKGQLLILGPFFAFWPLVSGRWGAAARLVSGFIVAAGVILSPWLLLNNQPLDWSVGPMRWLACVGMAALLAAGLSLYRRPLARRASAFAFQIRSVYRGLPADAPPPTSWVEPILFSLSVLGTMVVVSVLVLGRWPSDGEAPVRVAGLALLLGILIPPWFLPRRALGVWFALVIGASIWTGAFLFHGDWTWKTVGFEFGTRKWQMMSAGPQGMGSLPQIMQTRFGWNIDDILFSFHPPDLAGALGIARHTADGKIPAWISAAGLDGSAISLDYRHAMMVLFGLLTLLAAVGAAIQSRRNDPRFLAALSAIAAFMPNILCQMTARYQMWGAVMSVLLVAISPGLTLLHVLFSLIAAGMVGSQLLNSYDRSRSPLLADLMDRFHPDDGWIMLIIAAVFLYVALAPARRPDVELLDYERETARPARPISPAPK